MSQKPCPICRRPVREEYAPFCSKRCADIDLQRWFSGSYVVPAEEDTGRPGRGEDEPQ